MLVLSAVVFLAYIVASSPLAMSAVVVIVGAVLLSGPGVAPDAPGYLDRPAPVRVDVAPVRVRPRVTFTAPVWDAPTGADLWREVDRLVQCRDRAIRSRHRTRAETYQTRIDTLTRAAPALA